MLNNSRRVPLVPDLMEMEREVLGMDHSELGALYLESHRIGEDLVLAARYHHAPGDAPRYPALPAAVSIADRLVHLAGIGQGPLSEPPDIEPAFEDPCWDILFPGGPFAAQGALRETMESLPQTVAEMSAA